MSQILKDDLIAKIKDGIIVSCQALPQEPLIRKLEESFLSWSRQLSRAVL